MRIYLDESGNLGCGQGSSDYFVIAVLIAKNPDEMKRCILKVRKQKLRKKYKEIPELKWHNSSTTIRKRLLKLVGGKDVEIAYALLRKKQLYENLKNQPKVIYNYLCGQLVSKIFEKYGAKSLEIIIDRSLYGSDRTRFDEYLAYKTLITGKNCGSSDLSISVRHMDSQQEPCLQVVDFIAGAIHSSIRDKKSEYISTLKNKIRIQLDFFGNEDPKTR
ncbi:MAG: hypothetical protein CVT47_01225 [Thermoplasmata archaeon HGW-Thermoplasmata-2]|nr:MAG: hypothetical protein CVT47_01225 [Thermoplasmata archaeon HGW-Thermoplasmata-2]